MLTRQHCINILLCAQEWFNYILDTLYNIYKKCMCMEDCVEKQEYHYIDIYIPGPYDDIKNYNDYNYDGGFGYVYGSDCKFGYGYDN